MADQIALVAHPRAGSGKSEARALRRQGMVPAVAYGTDLASTAVSVDARELWHALRGAAGENAILRLDVAGDPHLALAREVQRHPVRREILHVDFVTVDRRRKVSVEVPIVLQGEAPGSDEGGVVEQALFSLPIEVLPLQVPDELTVDISELGVGDIIRVADVTLPEDVETAADAEATVVTVVVPQLEVPETGVDETAELADELEGEGETGDEAEATAEEAAGGEATGGQAGGEREDG